MSRKDNVIRVTDREKSIIELIREDEVLLAKGLEDCFEKYLRELGNKSISRDMEIVKALLMRIVGGGISMIDELIEGDFITTQEVNLINEAISDKENIVITGGTGVGKTSLLKGIINMQKEKNIVLCETYGELELSEETIKANNISYVDLSVELLEYHLKNNNYNKDTLFVISEITNSESLMNLFLVLDSGFSVLTSTHGSGDWISELSSRMAVRQGVTISRKLDKLIEETIIESKFLEVHVGLSKKSKNGILRKVENIKKHNYKKTKMLI